MLVLVDVFLYSALTILSSLSHSSFFHATVGLLFVSEDILGMVFSAACSMVLIRQLCFSLIMFLFCTFKLLCFLSEMRPICFSYAPSLPLFHEVLSFVFYNDGKVITFLEFIFIASFKFGGFC